MLRKFWDYICSWFAHDYRVVAVAEKPSVLKKYKVYLIGENDSFWAAVFICPCGCEADVWLNILRADNRPTWVVKGMCGNKATITPSIWRQVGCKSHFFIKNGRLIWA